MQYHTGDENKRTKVVVKWENDKKIKTSFSIVIVIYALLSRS